MSDHIFRFVSLAAILMLLLAGTPQPAGADGVLIASSTQDLEMPAQKAILVYDEESRHEDLILSVQLLGGSDAAWVVPVPSLPEVRTASPKWFEKLSELTAPRIEEKWEKCDDCPDGCFCAQTVGEEAGVELLSREQVGVYDVSILSADEPGTLLDWLHENGYAFPEEGGPLLDTYVEEGGWYFVAARVLPGESAALDGDAQPLWFSFDAEQPIYPMRLTALMKGRVHVLIYVLADHRMEIAAPTFETEFAGEFLRRRWVSTDPDLLKLLTSRTWYVTRLRRWNLNAPELAEDLYPQRASSDEAYEQVIYHTHHAYCVCFAATITPSAMASPSATASPAATAAPVGTVIPVALAAGLALLGLVAGLVLVRRLRSRSKSGNEP
jgi:hypothetical protein